MNIKYPIFPMLKNLEDNYFLIHESLNACSDNNFPFECLIQKTTDNSSLYGIIKIGNHVIKTREYFITSRISNQYSRLQAFHSYYRIRKEICKVYREWLLNNLFTKEN